MSSTATLKMVLLGDDRTASRALRGVGDTADRSSHKMAAFGRVARAGALGLAAGVGTAGIAAFKLAKGAAEDEKAAASLAQTLKNSADATKGQIAATEDWISAQGRALGVSDDQLRPALARLVTATGDVGKAQNLASLAMDVSAGTGRSLESVSTALMKAQNGQVSSLARLGINVKDAEGKTVSMREATRRMAETFRGQATEAADTTAGRFGRLKLMASEAGESIGYKLLPLATQFAGWMLSEGIPALTRFAGWIQDNVVPALRRFGDFIQDKVIPALQDFGRWIRDEIAPVVEHFYKTRVRQLIDAFKDMRDSVKGNEPELRQFGEWLKKAAEKAAQVLGPALEFLGGTQIRGLTTAFRVVVDYISGFVRTVGAVVDAAKHIGSAIAGAGERAIDMAADFGRMVQRVSGAVGDAVEVVRGLPTKVKSAVSGAAGWLVSAGADVVRGFISGIQSMAGSLVATIQSSITDKLPGFVKKALGIQSPSRVFMEIGANIMRGLINGIDKHRVPLGKVMDKVAAYVKSKGEKLKELLSARADFAAGFGRLGTSIFSADYSAATTIHGTDEEGNDVTSQRAVNIGDFLNQATSNRDTSGQVRADINKLIELGLSGAQIKKLQSEGDAATIHALAQGTRDQIAQLNALNAQSEANLTAAGMAAWQAVDGNAKALEKAKLDDARAEKLERLLERLADKADAPMKVTSVKVEGDKLVMVVRRDQADRGVPPRDRVK